MTNTTTTPPPITKVDTVALWYAVEAMGYAVGAMPGMTLSDGSTFTREQIDAERERLLQAKRALRKVNAIRKAQPAGPGTTRSNNKNPQVKHEPAGDAGGPP